MADLALKLNHYKLTIKGENFCQAEPGYMSGHKKASKKDHNRAEQQTTEEQTGSVSSDNTSRPDIENGKFRVEFLKNEVKLHAVKQQDRSENDKQSSSSLFVEIDQETPSYDREAEFEDIELGK